MPHNRGRVPAGEALDRQWGRRCRYGRETSGRLLISLAGTVKHKGCHGYDMTVTLDTAGGYASKLRTASSAPMAPGPFRHANECRREKRCHICRANRGFQAARTQAAV